MSSDRQDTIDPVRFAGLETIPLEIVVQVGSATLRLGRLHELQPGDLIPLDRKIGDPFELRSGGVVLARVEPVGNGDGIAVKIIEIPQEDDGDGD
jgi:flagellar motor switch/type III secretory pathway protein FliN